MRRTLLIVEDDNTMREMLGSVFRKKDIEVFESPNGSQGLDILQLQSIDVLLLDMNLPDMTGLELWAKTQEMDNCPLCIFMTAYPGVKMAVAAMKQGAYDYINKPFELDEMRIIVDKAFEVRELKDTVKKLKIEREYRRKSLGMIGQSDEIKHVQQQIHQVAKAESTPVLILGESGTGKELVADAIHNLSLRRENPMLKINCSTIPENLLESELFGHEKGAFTDAKTTKKGIFELAHEGTIFLDEIGDLDLPLQPKLLRVLESKTIRKVGGGKDTPIDVRVISATNQKLHEKVKDGSFRSDLIYRLNVFTIYMPPLRERVSDIPLLAEHYLEQMKSSIKKEFHGIEKQAIEQMKKYSWPGNIRELKNVIERACILATSDVITLKDCALDAAFAGAEPLHSRPVFTINNRWVTLEEVELAYIKSVLKHCSGNKSEAARQLDISRVTLREKLKKLDLIDIHN